MTALTNKLENKLLDWLFRGQAIGLNGATAAAGTGLANVYVGLFTTNPTEPSAGSEGSPGGTEVATGNYTRVTVASSLANWSGTSTGSGGSVSAGSDGTIKNVNAITFNAPTANWGTITGMGVFDTLTGGTLLFWSAISANKTVNNGDPAPSFPAGSLTLQIDD